LYLSSIWAAFGSGVNLCWSLKVCLGLEVFLEVHCFR
jgi:hypothetical protein